MIYFLFDKIYSFFNGHKNILVGSGSVIHWPRRSSPKEIFTDHNTVHVDRNFGNST